ncbi:MAG: hypothetical protein ACLFQB_15885, partial [Chitinispirillaceae bacterium]
MQSAIDSHFLNEFARCAFDALKKEDSYLAECRTKNRTAFKERKLGGILQLMSERYYQFLIARSLFAEFPYYVCTEHSSCSGLMDFAFFEDNTMEKIIGYGEMKNWMSSSGNTELAGIKNDIHRLRKTGSNGILLLCTAQPPCMREENKKYLQTRIKELAGLERSEHYFSTEGVNQDP